MANGRGGILHGNAYQKRMFEKMCELVEAAAGVQQVELVNPTDISTPIVTAVDAQTTSLTASLQAICDKLDAGITVTAEQGGTWSVTIDGQPLETSLSAETIDALIADLEAATLQVNIQGQDQDLNVNITNDPLTVTLDFAQLITALQAEVTKRYTPHHTRCIRDANGDEIPNTGVFYQYTVDFFGNDIGTPTEVYSQLVNGEWIEYTPAATDVVGRCEPTGVQAVCDVKALLNKKCYKRAGGQINTLFMTEVGFNGGSFVAYPASNPVSVFPSENGAQSKLRIYIQNAGPSAASDFELLVNGVVWPMTDSPLDTLIEGELTAGIYVYEFTAPAPQSPVNGEFVITANGTNPNILWSLGETNDDGQLDQVANAGFVRLLLGNGETETFCEITRGDKSIEFYDPLSNQIDALPSGLTPIPCTDNSDPAADVKVIISQECKDELAEKTSTPIVDAIAENTAAQVATTAAILAQVDTEIDGPFCYDIPQAPVTSIFNTQNDTNLGLDGIDFAVTAVNGGVINVSHSTVAFGIQSAGAFTGANTGRITVKFTTPQPLTSLRLRTLRNSAGPTTYSNFSSTPISASPSVADANANGSADLQAGGNVVVTTPADGAFSVFVGFDGSPVSEVSFDYDQPNAAFIHVTNIVTQPDPIMRRAVAVYEDGERVEYRDRLTQNVIPDADIYECDDAVKIDAACKREQAELNAAAIKALEVPKYEVVDLCEITNKTPGSLEYVDSVSPSLTAGDVDAAIAAAEAMDWPSITSTVETVNVGRLLDNDLVAGETTRELKRFYWCGESRTYRWTSSSEGSIVVRVNGAVVMSFSTTGGAIVTPSVTFNDGDLVELFNIDNGGTNSVWNLDAQQADGTFLSLQGGMDEFASQTKPVIVRRKAKMDIESCELTDFFTGASLDAADFVPCPVGMPNIEAAKPNTHIIEGCILSDPADPDSDKLSAFTIVNDAGETLFEPKPLTDLGFTEDCC